jgi:hypothetical protein
MLSPTYARAPLPSAARRSRLWTSSLVALHGARTRHVAAVVVCTVYDNIARGDWELQLPRRLGGGAWDSAESGSHTLSMDGFI